MPKPGRSLRPSPTTALGGLGSDVPELQKARALWQLNRFDEALELFEGAARKYPQNLVALIDASRALGARFEIARAETLLHSDQCSSWYPTLSSCAYSRLARGVG